MWNIKEDLIYGKEREYGVIKYLNDNIYLEDNVKLYSNEKKQVDFRNNEIVGELKSRTNKYKTYQTTMFGYNKLEYFNNLENENRILKFYFLFTDGLYVWTHNEQQYTLKNFNHKERGVVKQAYIDIKYLECLSRKITSINFK
tara:strand:+ start:2830 stop:3258 length:429 start_codon:yes stop_codon:yes gene_type:complete